MSSFIPFSIYFIVISASEPCDTYHVCIVPTVGNQDHAACAGGAALCKVQALFSHGRADHQVQDAPPERPQHALLPLHHSYLSFSEAVTSGRYEELVHIQHMFF